MDLRWALENRVLVPVFQPIVDLRTGQVAGCEVLTRWRHSCHGLMLPENLIGLAEENGFIGELTQQILRASFRTASALPDPLFLAVNISPVQLSDPLLPGLIRRTAEEGGFPLERLVVEITESALVSNFRRARKAALEIREMGCRLALDDFGTGYSSLRHLQALPFCKLKVDRSFVQSMPHERESRKIVAAVVGLGYSLGMTTVAEGVETDQEADILLGLGCDLAQGWLYSRPVPGEQLAPMLAAAPRTRSDLFSLVNGDRAGSGLEALPAQRLAQLQAIYDGAPVGLCFLDRNLRYISLNQRLADMNGAPVTAHAGRSVREMIPRLFPSVEPYLRRALRGEVIPKVEVSRPALTEDEDDRNMLLSYQPVVDEGGDVIGVSLAVVDITAL